MLCCCCNVDDENEDDPERNCSKLLISFLSLSNIVDVTDDVSSPPYEELPSYLFLVDDNRDDSLDDLVVLLLDARNVSPNIRRGGFDDDKVVLPSRPFMECFDGLSSTIRPRDEDMDT